MCIYIYIKSYMMIQGRQTGEKVSGHSGFPERFMWWTQSTCGHECTSVGSTRCRSKTPLMTVSVQGTCMQSLPISPKQHSVTTLCLASTVYAVLYVAKLCLMCTVDVQKWQANSGITSHRHQWMLLDSCVGDSHFSGQVNKIVHWSFYGRALTALQDAPEDLW